MSDAFKGWSSTINRRKFLKAGASAALISSMPGGLQTVSGKPVVGSAGRLDNGDAGAIVRAAIHPAIGVARVGNSPNEYYLGPEIPGGLPIAPGGYKDNHGAIKRQAARFRIYGLDANGEIVRELTNSEAKIDWTVHLANQKASWYDFETPLDIPEAIPTIRRNAQYEGRKRNALNINPGPRRLFGKNKRSVFNSGRFLNQRVYLGEIQTDERGRLLVLGGRGHSFSPEGLPLTTFGNNDGWTDDTSDRPVTARVRLGAVELPVEPAWVVVAPPNYAPALPADCSTLYDVISQTMIDSGWITPSPEVSFIADIFPIFQRLADLQWVNQGMLDRYGWQSPEEFMSPGYLARLADASPENSAFRQSLFARFRNPDYASLQEGLDILPPFYGDAITLPPESPRSFLAIQSFQFEKLSHWASGNFAIGVAGPVASKVEDLPINIQGDALDRAALEACLGDAFHPGCEMTWPMRIASMYASPFRLKHARPLKGSDKKGPGKANSGQKGNGKKGEPDYGEVLTPTKALSPEGPLTENWPGSVTRWMAVPWQTDTVSCRSGYQYGDTPVDPYLPTFWSARVPNHVMSMQDYETVIDETLPIAERTAAFFSRADFFRDVDQSEYQQTLQTMVDNWQHLGIVTELPGPGDSDFPLYFKVETDNDFSS